MGEGSGIEEEVRRQTTGGREEGDWELETYHDAQTPRGPTRGTKGRGPETPTD